MDLQEVDGKSVSVSQSETAHLNNLFASDEGPKPSKTSHDGSHNR